MFQEAAGSGGDVVQASLYLKHSGGVGKDRTRQPSEAMIMPSVLCEVSDPE